MDFAIGGRQLKDFSSQNFRCRTSNNTEKEQPSVGQYITAFEENLFTSLTFLERNIIPTYF